jgi:hypothetical protein
MAIIRAIETHYDGYKFRSRLEARWAVFFNKVNIEWEYEPQGLELKTPAGRIRYLPDFWLGTGQWAEVKGYLDVDAMRRLYAIGCGLAECGQGNDLVVFGDVPRLGDMKWPVQLHFHEKVLWGVPWIPEEGCPMRRPHVRITPDQMMAERLTDGFPFGTPDWAEDGLSAARQARFEWGQSG